MGKYEILDHLVETGNGYLQTAVVLEDLEGQETTSCRLGSGQFLDFFEGKPV